MENGVIPGGGGAAAGAQWNHPEIHPVGSGSVGGAAAGGGGGGARRSQPAGGSGYQPFSGPGMSHVALACVCVRSGMLTDGVGWFGAWWYVYCRLQTGR